jgi:hypothetical protein
VVAGEVAEVDVLGLVGDRTRLAGEAKWQAGAPHAREVQKLRDKLVSLPEPEPIWSWRSGPAPL